MIHYVINFVVVVVVFIANINPNSRFSCNDCESGKVECERCRASGSVRWFIHLSVRFNTIRDEYFNRETSIPYDLIRNAVSKRVYFEQDKKVNYECYK